MRNFDFFTCNNKTRSLLFLIINIVFCLQQNLSFGQTVTCSFDQHPEADLYFCGSTVTATVNFSNLQNGNNQLNICYPYQFSLQTINGNVVSPGLPISTTNFEISNATQTIPVSLLLSSIPITTTPLILVFEVSACSILNGADVSSLNQFPAYFEMYLMNGNNRTDAEFSQPVIELGQNGLVLFNNITNANFTGFTNELLPNYINPANQFNRSLSITTNATPMVGLEIQIEQESDVYLDNMEVETNSNDFVNVSSFTNNGANIYTAIISGDLLDQIDFNLPINFILKSGIDCDGLPSETKIKVRMLCENNCTLPFQQILTMDARLATERPFAITQSVMANSSGGGSCNSNFINTVNFEFTNVTIPLFINQLKIPLNTTIFSLDQVRIRDVNGTAIIIVSDFYEVSTDGYLYIDLDAFAESYQNNLQGLNFVNQINDKFITPTTGSFNIQVNLDMHYQTSALQSCAIVFDASLNNSNLFEIVFENYCFIETSVPKPTTPNIALHNNSYTLADGASINVLDFGNPSALIPFTYHFYKSGSGNPLALFNASNASLPNLFEPCSTVTYALHVSVQTPALVSPTGFSIFNTNNVLATFNGGSSVNGVLTNNELIFNLPLSELLSNEIQIEFELSFLNQTLCPFGALSANSGFVLFDAKIIASCNQCENLKRTLACANGAADFVLVKCSGGCGEGNPVGTSSFDIKRATLGWADAAAYGTDGNGAPLANINELRNKILAAHPSWTTEEIDEELELTLETIYPFDLVHVSARGFYQKQNQNQPLSFQIAHTPLFANANQNSSFLNLEAARITFIDANSNVIYTTNPLQISDFNASASVTGLDGVVFSKLLLNVSNAIDISYLNSLPFMVDYDIRLDAIFRVRPNTNLLPNNAYGASGLNTIACLGQFVASNSNDVNGNGSCDPFTRSLKLLLPGITAHRGAEVIANHNVSLELDNPTASFDFETSPTSLHNYCNANAAFGIYLYGGYGPLNRDFKYEFRPIIKWPTSANLGANQLRITAVNSLYSEGPLAVNSNEFTSSTVGAPILPPRMKGIPNQNNYQGLAFTLRKDAYNSIVCAPEYNATILNFYPNIGVTKFASVHPNFVSNTNTPFPAGFPPTFPFSLSPPTLFDVFIPNINLPDNPYVVTPSLDLCTVLSGAVSTTPIPVGENLDYSFTIGNTNLVNAPETKNVWVSYRIIKTDEFGNQTFTYPNYDNSFTTTVNTNGYIIQNPSNVNQFVYYFPSGLPQPVALTVPTFLLPCGEESLSLEINFGMYCNDDAISEHFNSTPPPTCFTCTKTIALTRNTGVLYTSNSSLDFQDCQLNWNIELQNPAINATITNPEFKITLPAGLLPNNNLIITYNQNGTITNPAYTLTYTGIGITGGVPQGDVQPVMNFNFADNFNFASGSTLRFQLSFSFSNSLCDQIGGKQYTALTQTLLGQTICNNNNEVAEIPISSNIVNLPVRLNDVPDFISQLLGTPEGSSGCCVQTNVLFNTRGACLGYNLGSIEINDVVVNTQMGNIGNCTFTIFNIDNEQVAQQTPSNSNPLIIPNLQPGVYTMLISITGQDYDFIQGFIIQGATDDCNCDCGGLTYSLPEIIYIENSSDFINQFNNGSSYVANRCIKFKNNFVVNAEITFNDCKLIFDNGKQMTVAYGSKLNAENKTVFRGCDKMWKGIVNHGKILMDNAFIKDAQYGIEAVTYISQAPPWPGSPANTNQPYSILNSVTFSNNFIGYTNITQNDPWGVTYHTTVLKSCNFLGGQLLPNFDNQTPLANIEGGLAGIRINNRFALTVDGSNKFENLFNGIIVNKASLTVKDAKFNNIRNDAFPELYSGNCAEAIDLNNCASGESISTPSAAINSFNGSRVKISSINTTDQSYRMFDNCKIGVSSNYSTIEVDGCRFVNNESQLTDIAIRIVRSTNGHRFKLNNNRIYSNNNGISIFWSNNPFISKKKRNSITQNTILLDQNTLTDDISSRYGINNSIDYAQFLSGTFYKDNDVLTYTYDRNNGIHAQNVYFHSYTKNRNFRYSQSDGVGLGAELSMGLYVGNNYSESSSSAGQGENQAYNYRAVNNSKILENCSEGTRVGFKFSDTNTGLVIAENNLGFHGAQNDNLWLGASLHLTANGFIGAQDDARNYFNFNPIDANRTIAWDQNLTPGQNRFIVQTSISNPYTLQNYYPKHEPESPDNNCQTDPFFRCINLDPDNLYPAAPFDCSSLTYDFDRFTTLEQRIMERTAHAYATDSLFFDLFPNVSLHKVGRSIAENLANGRLVLPDTGIYADMKLSLFQSSLAKFNKVDSLLPYNYNDSLMIFALEVIDNKLNYWDSVSATLSQNLMLDSLNFNNQVLADYYFARDSVYYYWDAWLAHQVLVKYKLSTQTNLAQTINAAIPFGMGSTHEYNERTINAILLQLASQDQFELSESQKQTIESLAYLCPLSEGIAVYKARSIVYGYNPNAWFDNDSLCAIVGMQYRMAQQTKEKTSKQNTLNAYPNPSNDKLTVNLFNGIDYLPIKRLEIYNLMGQLIYKTSNTSNEINLSLKSENISSGILLIKVQDASNNSFQTRVIYEK